MRSAGVRWAILVTVPLLVGAVLLMHGIDAAAHAAPPPAAAAPDHQDHHRSDQPCDTCPAAHHLVIACVAVALTIATVDRARLRPGPALAAPAVALVAALRDRVAAVARPPDPAWVRLGVMRC